MGGLGGAEVLIIAAAVILLFGPSLVSFWIGFTLGRKTTAEKYEQAQSTAPEPEELPEQESEDE
jgi:Sec-independent protein translocase protein TatA